jgi:PAS domain S-box-containing protein
VYDDLITTLHFPSRDEAGPAMDYAGRMIRLKDERLHIGHFVVALPDEVHWSAEMFDIFGVPHRPGPLRLADVIEPFDSEDRVRLGELIRTSLRDRKGYHAKLRVRHPDGDLRLVETVGDVVVEDGRLAAVVGLLRDITSSAAAPMAGSDLERMRALIEAMPTPALLTDHEMRILACSDMWAKSHGVIASQVLGQDVLKVVHKAPVGWSLEHEKVLGGKAVTTDRMFHNPATGRPAKCMCSVLPWVVGDGTIRGAITIIGWSDFAYASKEIAAYVKAQRIRA